MADDITEAKRASEVALRPGKTAPTPVPSGLRNEYSDASYTMVKKPEAKPKSETATSLDWNAQQRKVAEQ